MQNEYLMILDLEEARRQCQRDHCASKAGNLHCDEECNKYACDFDGQDCSLGINPWRNCTVPRCWERFGDKICNPECNTVDCLFDGRDCDKKLKRCNPVDNNFCKGSSFTYLFLSK